MESIGGGQQLAAQLSIVKFCAHDTMPLFRRVEFLYVILRSLSFGNRQD
jgi:hypothetical protein